MNHPDRRFFDRLTLPWLRGLGFSQGADALYQQHINYVVESEIAGSEDSDKAYLAYLRAALS